MKRILLNLTILLITTTACAFVAEWAVRLLLPVYDPSGNIEFRIVEGGMSIGLVSQERRHWTRTGDFDVPVVFNEYGLRDHKGLLSADSLDWWAFGDSFTFGWGVQEEERFSDQIHELLGMPVYNLAAPNDLDGYLRLLDYVEAQGAEPVLRVILGICMENHLKYYRPEGPASDRAEPMHEFRFNVGLQRLKSILGQRSALYTAFATLVHQNHQLRRVALRWGLIERAADTVNENRFDSDGLRSSADRVAHIFESRQGVAVIIPSRALWLGSNREVEDSVHVEFIRLLRERSVRVVDLRPAWEQGGDPLQYHFAENGHWNPSGHFLAAKVIADSLGSLAATWATVGGPAGTTP